MILVLLRHTPNPSSKFIDLGVEIPCARGTFVKFESTLYGLIGVCPPEAVAPGGGALEGGLGVVGVPGWWAGRLECQDGVEGR